MSENADMIRIAQEATKPRRHDLGMSGICIACGCTEQEIIKGVTCELVNRRKKVPNW